MKKITILFFFLTSLVMIPGFTSGQDLIQSTKAGTYEIPIAKPNVIYQKVEQAKVAQPVFDRYGFFEVSSDLTAHQKASTEVADAVILRVEEDKLTELVKEQPYGMLMEVPVSEGRMIELELVRSNPLADDFTLHTSDGMVKTLDDFEAVFYRGIIKGHPQSIVSITIGGGMLRGLISDSNGNYVLGPIDASQKAKETYVLYNDRERLNPEDFVCEYVDDGESTRKGRNDLDPSEKNFADPCIGIYVECDFEMYQDNSSDVQLTFLYVAALLNEVGIIYDNENVQISLSAVFVWTEADPWDGLGDTGDILPSFRAYHNQTFPFKYFQLLSPEAELAHLLISRRVGGGRAYRDELCEDSPYAVSGGMGAFNNFPVYSWEVMVFSHEMGHNLGSRHTHDCVWNGNNTQIDDCGNIWLESEGEDTGDCYDNTSTIVPPGGGTIMSYCHINAVGIDLALGFGPQPGDVIRETYNNAGCLEDCGEKNCPIFLDLTQASPGTITGGPEIHTASSRLTASNTIASSGIAVYGAGEEIILQPGFTATTGCEFYAIIDECGILIYEDGLQESPDENMLSSRGEEATALAKPQRELSIYPNPSNSAVNIEFFVEKADRAVELQILDVMGKRIQLVHQARAANQGWHRFTIGERDLPPGIYFVQLQIENNQALTKRLIIN